MTRTVDDVLYAFNAGDIPYDRDMALCCDEILRLRALTTWRPISEARGDGREVLAGFRAQFKWVYFIAHDYLQERGGIWAPGYARPTHFLPLLPPSAEEIRT